MSHHGSDPFDDNPAHAEFMRLLKDTASSQSQAQKAKKA